MRSQFLRQGQASHFSPFLSYYAAQGHPFVQAIMPNLRLPLGRKGRELIQDALSDAIGVRHVAYHEFTQQRYS